LTRGCDAVANAKCDIVAYLAKRQDKPPRVRFERLRGVLWDAWAEARVEGIITMRDGNACLTDIGQALAARLGPIHPRSKRLGFSQARPRRAPARRRRNEPMTAIADDFDDEAPARARRFGALVQAGEPISPEVNEAFLDDLVSSAPSRPP
jgi:hypothetical protein